MACSRRSGSVGGAGRDSHDGTIIPEAAEPALGHRCHHGLDPQRRLGVDVRVVGHYTAEAWAHVAKIGDRFAALQPVYDAVIDRFGRPGPLTWPAACAAP